MPEMEQLKRSQGGPGRRCLCALGGMGRAPQRQARVLFTLLSVLPSQAWETARRLGFCQPLECPGDHKTLTNSNTNSANSQMAQHSRRRGLLPTHPTLCHEEMRILFSTAKWYSRDIVPVTFMGTLPGKRSCIFK